MKKSLMLKNYFHENKLFSHRIIATIVIIIILTCCLIARLFYLQVIDKKLYTTLSQENRLDLIPITPNRGLIYDRNGVLLATNEPVFSLDITPEQVPNLKKTIQRLRKFIPISEQDLQQFYKSLKRRRPYEAVPLKLKLNEKEVAMFYVQQFRYPGVSIQARLLRYYPLGKGVSDVVGYVGRISEKDLERINKANYSGSDYIGKMGIEKYYEKQLHGVVGYQQVETDATGRIVRTLNRTAPIPGNKIYLTIDSKLQAVAEKAFGTENGALVAIQPSTGQVLALVSHPSYDPNQFVLGLTQKQYQELQNAPNRPLFNRAVMGAFPFASTIKPFLTVEALRDHVITPSYTIVDPGWFKLPNSRHIYNDWKKGGHGVVDLRKAIIVSCDTYFYGLAVKMGIKRIDKILTAFGFGQPTGIDLPQESTGVVPSPKWKLTNRGESWYPGDTVITGIGQGFLLTTMLQLADGAATIANRGKRYKPTLLLKMAEPDGTVVKPKPVPKKPVKAKKWIWKFVIDAMVGVVEAPFGTGYRFGRNPPYPVAAKTGTAQVYEPPEYRGIKDQLSVPKKYRNHSLFIAFAPVDHPQIAIAVIVEHATKGEYIAATVARKVLDYYFLKEHHLQDADEPTT